MKANTCIATNGKTGEQKEETTIDSIFSQIACVSPSEDGKFLYFTDYSGQSIRVRLNSIPIKNGTNCDSNVSFRCAGAHACDCIYDMFCGIRVLIDPRTRQPCCHR